MRAACVQLAVFAAIVALSYLVGWHVVNLASLVRRAGMCATLGQVIQQVTEEVNWQGMPSELSLLRFELRRTWNYACPANDELAYAAWAMVVQCAMCAVCVVWMICRA